jgi:hypothetical protein
MKLHLKNGEVIEIFRQTCGYYYKNSFNGSWGCEWNIDPVNLIGLNSKGSFVLGKWGCDGYHDDCGRYVRTPEDFEKLIPIDSVIYVSEIEKWEKP